MGLRRAWHALFSAETETFAANDYKPVNALVEGLFPGYPLNVGRDEALSVPALLRGRNMICSIGTLPLECVDLQNNVIDSPLLRQINPNIPNVVTLSQTVEDLLFEAVAWWRVLAFGWDGRPVSARRVDPKHVSADPPIGYTPSLLPSGLPDEQVLWMDGKPVPYSQIIGFSSPNPPVLGPAGRRTIARAIAIDKAAEMYSNDPRPMDYFTPAEGVDPAEDDAVADMLSSWSKARQKRSTVYVPAALQYNEVQQPTPADLQLVQLQRQASLDVANLLGIDPEDVGVSTTSRTYQNATDRRKDRVNDVLASYMKAITDRLSMPDVTNRNQLVRFNLTDFLKADPKTRAEVQQAYVSMGAIDAADVRQEEGWAPKVIVKPEPAVKVPSVTGAPVQAIEASKPAEYTFGRTDLQFADTALDFAVDAAARTITGLAVPYGQQAYRGGVNWRFAAGSVKYSAVNRVKLLRDHDNAQAIGKAISLTETPEGLVATFRVAPGARGDEALALAADGVLDGLSIGVEFRSEDTVDDPKFIGGRLVTSAALREVSLTAMPAFDDSRLTSVTASAEREEPAMAEETTETPAVTQPVSFSAEQFDRFLENLPKAADVRPVVNPTETLAVTFVQEALPYTFDRAGNFTKGEHEFSGDLLQMSRSGDDGFNNGRGPQTEEAKRVMGMIQAQFANTTTSTTATLNPSIQRPDMYVDQRDYKYPLYASVNKGAPPNGVTPFVFPKFSSNGTLVGPHTEGTEPTAGAFTTTNQTVTPAAQSGKASLTREVWDQGGNPAVSGLIWNQMRRSWNEGLETATGTFLNTLTAATDINLGVAPTGAALVAAWDAAIAGLQYTRGYDWDMFAVEQYLYADFVKAADSTGRKLYPIISPMNANGQAVEKFRYLNAAGITAIPAWGLGAGTTGVANNSWLFDPSCVHGWSTAPQRLEFPGTSAAGAYAPVAMVDIGIWGYTAFACSDIGGVRQVIYDNA